MHPAEIRDAARAAYVFEGLDIAGIERRLRLPQRTVKRWKTLACRRGDDWDAARGAMRMTRKSDEIIAAAVLEDFVLLFQSTMKDLKADTEIKTMQKVEILARLSDAYNKTVAAMRRAAPQLSKLAVAMEVLELLAEFVRAKAPEGAAALLAVLEPFGQELTAKLE